LVDLWHWVSRMVVHRMYDNMIGERYNLRALNIIKKKSSGGGSIPITPPP